MDLLLFEIDGTRIAIDHREVMEVLPLGPLARVPRAPAAIVGVVSLKGRVVPVVDLGQILAGRFLARRSQGDPVLFVHAGKYEAVLHVGRIEDVAHVAAPRLLATGLKSGALLGLLDTEVGPVHLLDLGHVLETLARSVTTEGLGSRGGSPSD